MQKIKIILILLLFSCSTFSQVSYRVTFDSKDLTIEKKDGYDVIKMKGLKNSGEKGAPSLPFKGINLIIPTASDVDNIKITKKVTKIIEGNFYVAPQSQEDRDGKAAKEATKPDPIIYAMDKPYPEKFIQNVSAGYFDGATRITNIRVNPLLYTTKEGKLELITELEFTLLLKGTSEQPIYVKKRMIKDQEMIDNLLPTLVDNKSDIGKYHVRPAALVENISKSEISKNGKAVQTPGLFPINADYLIITSTPLSGYFNSFISNKMAYGIFPRVVTTGQIYSYYANSGDIVNGVTSISDNAGKIRQFIRDAYAQGVVYVLLAGDHNVVPIRMGWYENYQTYLYYQNLGIFIDHKGAADIYFSDLNTNWNTNQNSYYGEPGWVNNNILYPGDGTFDPYPEVYVGRIPFTNGTEIANWINKVISYNIPVNKVLWTWADKMQEYIDETDWRIYFPSNYQHTYITELPSWNSLSPSAPFGNQIISTLNQNYGFWVIHNHGTPIVAAIRTEGNNLSGDHKKWGIFSNDADDNYNQNLDPWNRYYNVENGNGLDNITTNNTIIYSCACENGSFHETPTGYENFAKTFLKLQNGGPAILANSGAGGEVRSPLMEAFFWERLFNGNSTFDQRLGILEALHKVDNWNYGPSNMKEWMPYVHNLFGDPSMRLSSSGAGQPIKNKENLITSSSVNIPKQFNLYQNYPNPFNPSTTIKFDLPEATHVELKVFDLFGKEVMTLKNEYMDAGFRNISFNGKGLASGFYIYKIKTEKNIQVRKMCLIK